MKAGSFKNLAVVVSIYFLTVNFTEMFLSIFFIESGMKVADVVTILLITFLVIGLMPLALLRFFKNFERLICCGILFTMIFYIVLIFVKNPIIIGLVYGLSSATFWPSYNLLQFRLSESKVRARTVSLFSSIIPTVASTVGPALGGIFIENFGFHKLFYLSISLYFISLAFSTRIRFKCEVYGLSLPKERKIFIFFITFIIFGMTEAYWLSYPLFVKQILETASMTGFIFSITGIVMSIITFLVNWLSDIKMWRVEFTVIGTLLNAAWFFLIGLASAPQHLVLLSSLSGMAGAFTISWLAHYGDMFSRRYYASILVFMEAGLMVGRIIGLLPTYMFISVGNYLDYFRLLGIFHLSVIPFLLMVKVG